MGIVTLRAGIPGMCIRQVWHFVTRNVDLAMAFQAQVSCGVEILVFIDGWDRQPGNLRLDLAFFHPMANVAGYIGPISLCDRWGWRGNLKFTSCTTRWHIVQRRYIVDWRVTARTRAVHSQFIQDIRIPVRADFPHGLDR